MTMGASRELMHTSEPLTEPTTQLTAAAVEKRLSTALLHYLESVAGALNTLRIAVAGVQSTRTREALGGRIQLAKQARRIDLRRVGIELRWVETTGWEVDLRHDRDDEPVPWRFLHVGLVPSPSQVAGFAAGLLRGEDLGMAYPVQFRQIGQNPQSLMTTLAAPW